MQAAPKRVFPQGLARCVLSTGILWMFILFNVLCLTLILSAGICAARQPVIISEPILVPDEAQPIGTDHSKAGFWNCMIRGNRFNMYTESPGGQYRATLILSVRRDAATNMRISIWSPNEPPDDYPDQTGITVEAGGKTLQLESQNDTEIRLFGCGYVYNLISDSPQILNQIRELMLTNKSITFKPGDDDFITSFSLDGFLAIIGLANEWFYGEGGSKS